MKTARLVCIVCLFFGIVSVFAVLSAAENKGAEKMVLSKGKGKGGRVPFPHALHQTTLSDCNVCHGLFPQSSGAIEDGKKQGTLKKKQVMRQCTKCHRKKKKAGEKTGPLRCKTCHSG